MACLKKREEELNFLLDSVYGSQSYIYFSIFERVVKITLIENEMFLFWLALFFSVKTGNKML